MRMNIVQHLKSIFGGSYAAVGKALGGLSGEAIRKWEKNGIPAERVREIAEATNWRITPHQLAPHIYPHPDDGLPEMFRGTAVEAAARDSWATGTASEEAA